MYHYFSNRKYQKHFLTADGMIVSKGNSVVPALKSMLTLATDTYSLNRVYYMVVHPSIDTTGLDKSNLRESRVDEYKFLMNSNFLDNLKKKIELTNFKSL